MTGSTTGSTADRDARRLVLGGRLGDSIRERQGMAYYAGSTFEANVMPPFSVMCRLMS